MKTIKIRLVVREHKAFTLIELLVVVAMLALGALLLASALSHTRPNVQAARCLNNMRQLMGAMAMYTHDYSELFPPNPDENFSGNPGYNWVQGFASGWMPNTSAGGSPDAGNPDLLRDPTRNLLANYIRTNISLFRCPFDPRTCPYSGSDPSQFGRIIPVVRSISMNQGVGTKGFGFGYTGSGANSAVDGPWLDGSHSHTANKPYATFGKTSDFKVARPADIWVLADDDPWTINDAAEAVIAAMPDLVNYPSVMNNNATAFAFADAHAEIHKWNLFIHTGIPPRTTANPGLQYKDWFWWAWHATRSVVTGTVP
jgi:prepilin-type N-terminal cleavage/methylation domain-containing protein